MQSVVIYFYKKRIFWKLRIKLQLFIKISYIQKGMLGSRKEKGNHYEKIVLPMHAAGHDPGAVCLRF